MAGPSPKFRARNPYDTAKSVTGHAHTSRGDLSYVIDSKPSEVYDHEPPMSRLNRRKFLTSTASALALSTLAPAGLAADPKPKRVGLIGCGWYGKTDLFRLIQIAPTVAPI